MNQYPINELKMIYSLLHTQITEHIELMDSQLLDDLQGYLQGQATEDGIDVTLHSEWLAWLTRR